MKSVRYLSLFLLVFAGVIYGQKKKTLVRYAKQTQLFKNDSAYEERIYYKLLKAAEKSMKKENSELYERYIELAYTTIHDLPIDVAGIRARAEYTQAMRDDLIIRCDKLLACY